jgi:hypothetical protein
MSAILTDEETARRAAWEASLPEAQAKRHYEPFGRDHDPAIFVRVGAFLHVTRTDGKVAVIDPNLPWNDCTVEVIAVEASKYLREMAEGRRPGAFDPTSQKGSRRTP